MGKFCSLVAPIASMSRNDQRQHSGCDHSELACGKRCSLTVSGLCVLFVLGGCAFALVCALACRRMGPVPVVVAHALARPLWCFGACTNLNPM